MKTDKEIVLCSGTMFSGKTTTASLIAKKNRQNIVIVESGHNTRNSERDINNILSGYNILDFKEAIKIQKDFSNKILLLDEIHFYDVFLEKDEFINFIKETNAKTIFCFGIKYDFFHFFRPFPVWNSLEKLKKEGSIAIENREFFAIDPCPMCETFIGVKHSIPILDSNKNFEKISSKYSVACATCAKAYFIFFQTITNKSLSGREKILQLMKNEYIINFNGLSNPTIDDIEIYFRNIHNWRIIDRETIEKMIQLSPWD